MSGEASVAAINPKNYKFLQEHVYSHAGIVLEGDKHYLICSPCDQSHRTMSTIMFAVPFAGGTKARPEMGRTKGLGASDSGAFGFIHAIWRC